MKKYLTFNNIVIIFSGVVLGPLAVRGTLSYFEAIIMFLCINFVLALDTLYGQLEDIKDLQTVIARGIYGRFVSGEGDEGND